MTCYDISKAVPPGPFKVRAHEVRALASSLAYNAKAPLERVLEGARGLAITHSLLFILGTGVDITKKV